MRKLLFDVSYLAARLLGKASRSFLALSQRFVSREWQAAATVASTNYDMMSAPDERYYADQYWRLLAPALQGIASEARCLDLGCSQGRFSLRLAERFPQGSVIACDLSRSAIDAARVSARERGMRNVDFRVDSIGALLSGLPSDSQDVLFMTEVTFFYPEWQAAYPRMLEVLRPGGLLVMSFRSQYFYSLYVARARLWSSVSTVVDARRGKILGSPTEFSWQTSSEIRQLFEQSGVTLVSIYGIGVCSGIPGDPHDVIARPSQLHPGEAGSLMDLECALAASNPDAGRYLLAIGRKAIAS